MAVPTVIELGFDADAAWALHESVAVRPERFGALLYDFRTRRLTFVKDPVLQRVIDALPTAASARASLELANVPEEDRDRYLQALARLVETSMLTPRAQGESE
jgi:putative mycofactocin binding protein MftB